jgi:anti-anti-sigma factor
VDSAHLLLKWPLRVVTESSAGVPVLIVAGRLGSASSGGLAQAVSAALTGGNSRVIIDLTGVDYVSSAGIGVLRESTARARTSGGILILTGISEPVRLTLELAGLLTEFDVEPTRESAVSRARS